MLFDCSASVSQMSSSVYAEQMNCDYNHSLDDIELQSVIDSLHSRNLIHPIGNTVNSVETAFTLTESGGELWERERQPDWQCYVTTSQKELGSFPTGSIIALCIDEQIARKCLGAMFASGLITANGPIRTRELYDKRLVPWKSFPSVYAARCQTSDNIHHPPKPIEWCVYESSRCWWCSIGELLTLRV